MPLQSYPDKIPGPSREGLTIQEKIRETEVETEIGHVRKREWGQGDAYIVSCLFKFGTKADEDSFFEFVQYTINYGRDWFLADWFTGAGFAADTWAFKILDMPLRASGFKREFQVSMVMQNKNDVPEPDPDWPNTDPDPGYVQRRYGIISPASPIVSATTTTVTLNAGVVASDRWKVGWFFAVYNLETGIRDQGPFEIDSINGDEITFSPAASPAPDNTQGIMFGDYDECSQGQKDAYVFISDGTNNFGDGGSPYELTYPE